MEGYRLIEDYGGYRQPVASVIEIHGEKALYRNITDKHFFCKGDYCALFTDDAVINWLTTLDTSVQTVVFDTGTASYSVSIAQYKNAKPKRMSGRLQRGVSLDRFIKGAPIKAQRPAEEKVIQIKHD